MENHPERTAIKRNKLSKPMDWLVSNGFLVNKSILDYGCGRGDDVGWLRECGFPDVVAFDPHFYNRPPTRQFDVVTCLYVLNVLPKDQEWDVLTKAFSYVAPQGTLFVAVRNDKFKEGPTGRKTYQRHVTLELPLLVIKRGFKIYRITELPQDIDFKKELEKL